MRSNGHPDNAIAVVLAGGNGTRLDPLTRHICKPAVPFGGRFRSIDFSLANCANSGLRAVGVATQYKPDVLLAHLRDDWNVASRDSPLIVPWHAAECAPGNGYRGTADAVYRNLERIEDFDPDLVLILAGDHVYKMDYRPMLAEHCARGADVTVGCVDVPAEDARHFGVMTVDEHGRVERFIEKPRSHADLPERYRDTVPASMGIYVFNADFLARVLQADARSTTSRHDFGNDILPKLVGASSVLAHAFRDGGGSTKPYWRDIGTLQAYWQAHMDLLEPAPRLTLDDAAWPIGPRATAPSETAAPAVTGRSGNIHRSIVGTGCRVAGYLSHSVLFDGAELEPGATVIDSVVLPGARIGAGSRLRGVIVGEKHCVPAGTLLERPAAVVEPWVLIDGAPDASARRAAGV
jgi:glucose-1-phosphate adenylyltransferase